VRVFVAGASGAIGRPLVRQLLEAGHELTAMTRRPEAAEEIRAAGAEAAVCDVFDPAALNDAVAAARPEVVVNELTSLPSDLNPLKIDEQLYAATNRVRAEGSGNLIAAARAGGARRFITQSIAFIYAPLGDMVVTEEAPAFDPARLPEPYGSGTRVMLDHERAALEAEGIEALVLRYGWFYGPGTYYAADGSIAGLVRRRRYPRIAGSEGRFSFIHIDDAAAATVAACERGPQGIYNIVDDEPATLADWLPAYAEALGAKRPWSLPGWVARLFGGSVARMLSELRGASNAKAKRDLGWQPRYPSWRQGFREGLG
jgi:nucleoside-diphosphate-sugar epimerase